MKSFKRKITITYSWYSYDAKPMFPPHVAELESAARNTIREMQDGGYTSGTLNWFIGEATYRGTWQVISNEEGAK